MECKVCGHDNLPEASFCANCGSPLAARDKPPVPTVAPGYPEAPPPLSMEYMGFWIRFGAAIVDYLIILAALVITRLLFRAFFIYSLVLFFSLPWLYHWLFIGLRGQTPGKMLLGMKVVNAQGHIPGLGQAALREIPGKLVSAIALYIGFIWIAFDRNKQGWHDKLVHTYVVKAESGS